MEYSHFLQSQHIWQEMQVTSGAVDIRLPLVNRSSSEAYLYSDKDDTSCFLMRMKKGFVITLNTLVISLNTLN